MYFKKWSGLSIYSSFPESTPYILGPKLSYHCAANALAPNSAAWWRHQMETFSAFLAICAGNSPVPGEFPAQRPVTRSFDVFFDLRLNYRLSKRLWGWWFETLSRPLWRHCNGAINRRPDTVPSTKLAIPPSSSIWLSIIFKHFLKRWWQ